MTTTLPIIKDPVCGMTVDAKTALHADYKGQTFYFCSPACRTTFLASPEDVAKKGKAGGCCG
jgi:Cu+-exporting ATPase